MPVMRGYIITNSYSEQCNRGAVNRKYTVRNCAVFYRIVMYFRRELRCLRGMYFIIMSSRWPRGIMSALCDPLSEDVYFNAARANGVANIARCYPQRYQRKNRCMSIKINFPTDGPLLPVNYPRANNRRSERVEIKHVEISDIHPVSITPNSIARANCDF